MINDPKEHRKRVEIHGYHNLQELPFHHHPAFTRNCSGGFFNICANKSEYFVFRISDKYGWTEIDDNVHHQHWGVTDEDCFPI